MTWNTPEVYDAGIQKYLSLAREGDKKPQEIIQNALSYADQVVCAHLFNNKKRSPEYQAWRASLMKELKPEMDTLEGTLAELTESIEGTQRQISEIGGLLRIADAAPKRGYKTARTYHRKPAEDQSGKIPYAQAVPLIAKKTGFSRGTLLNSTWRSKQKMYDFLESEGKRLMIAKKDLPKLIKYLKNKE